jgi:hypothetical protein
MQQRLGRLRPTAAAQQAAPAAPRAPLADCRRPVAAARAAAADATTTTLAPTRRAILLATLSAAFATSTALPRPALAASKPTGERPAAAAVREYSDLEARGKAADAKALDALRLKYGVRRAPDGRISVRAPSSGAWHAVRLDMEVPGTLLLREQGSGTVFALETASLAQVDLSDDTVVLMLFADGQWEQEMATIDVRDPEAEKRMGKGKGGKPLTMSEREFREVVGLLKGSEGA